MNDNPKFEILPEKKQAKDLKFGDYIVVDNALWHVVEGARSMGNPNHMLKLAYYTHHSPKSFKFHAVRDEERFEVFRSTE